MDTLLPIVEVDPYPFQSGIAGFSDVLPALDEMLEDYPVLRASMFEGSEEWRRLLQHKLAPQLSGDGCLVVAVAGGTNTGKSTLFNLLLCDATSAARSVAAATCAPVLVTSPGRFQDGLMGRLLPEFSPAPLMSPDDATRRDLPEDILWVACSELLPDTLALLDTPDVDSIEKRNWVVADHIRAAGDVVIAMLTPEKYKDARVVEFFRQAHASGRMVIPIMNKANPNNNYAAARVQLDEFVHDAGLDASVCFALPFDYAYETDVNRGVYAIDQDISLMDYLRELDVAAIKRSVYRDTLAYFLEESGLFLERAAMLRARVETITPAFQRQAEALATGYHPQPGEGMGTLLHEQIRAQRSFVVRHIARFNDAALRGIKPVTGFIHRRILGASAESPLSEEERLQQLREHQRRHIARIANDFASFLTETARGAEPVVKSLIEAGDAEIDVAVAVERISEEMLGCGEEVSDAFKVHVARTVEAWWHGNPAQRRMLLELDALMVFAPTALCVPAAVFTAGVGAPEVMALAGPMAGEFVARIMEQRFAEQWINLLEPWQREQRERLAVSLRTHLTAPALRAVDDALAIFDYGCLDKLRSYWELCQLGLQTS